MQTRPSPLCVPTRLPACLPASRPPTCPPVPACRRQAEAIAACYKLLPAVHRLFRRVAGEEDDYIAQPKVGRGWVGWQGRAGRDGAVVYRAGAACGSAFQGDCWSHPPPGLCAPSPTHPAWPCRPASLLLTPACSPRGTRACTPRWWGLAACPWRFRCAPAACTRMQSMVRVGWGAVGGALVDVGWGGARGRFHVVATSSMHWGAEHGVWGGMNGVWLGCGLRRGCAKWIVGWQAELAMCGGVDMGVVRPAGASFSAPPPSTRHSVHCVQARRRTGPTKRSHLRLPQPQPPPQRSPR